MPKGRTDRDTFERAVRSCALLYAGQTLTAKTLMREFNVCLSTAHRDLVALETLLPVEVTEIHQPPWPHPRKEMRLPGHRNG
jgi:hypothetical protein